jgi:hypothetical protein
MIFKKILVVIAFLLVGCLMYGISYEGWFLQKIDRTDQYNSSAHHRSVRGGGFNHGK